MSLDESIGDIFVRLGAWAGFPKYALERRIDMFLVPFLENYLSAALSDGGAAPRVTLVAPEFPILASILPRRRKVPSASGRPPPELLTVNADFLLFVDRPGAPCWLLLELKTNAASFDQTQLDRYLVARNRKMPQLLLDLENVEHASSKSKKYGKLRNVIAESGFVFDLPIEVAYLAPRAILRGAKRISERWGDAEACLFSLERFVEWNDAHVSDRHRALWVRVRGPLGGEGHGPAARSADARLLTATLVAEAKRCEARDPTIAFRRYRELHLCHAIARSLERDVGGWVVLEATDGRAYRGNERCDVYAEMPGGDELWIEVKKAWRGPGGDDWNNKPRDQLRKWVTDLQRLLRVAPPSRRAFVLAQYSQGDDGSASDPKVIEQIGRAIGERVLGGRAWDDLLPQERMTPADAPAYLEAVLRAASDDVHAENHTGEVDDGGNKVEYRFVAAVF